MSTGMIPKAYTLLLVGLIVAPTHQRHVDRFYTEEIHAEMTRRAGLRAKVATVGYPENSYEEVGRQLDLMAAASAAEDRPESKVLRHFYQFTTASGLIGFESARVRAATFWNDALGQYSCSTPAAFDRLAVVLHLVQDMVQPDHAAGRPHLGAYWNLGEREGRWAGFEPFWETVAVWDPVSDTEIDAARSSFRSLSQRFDEVAGWTMSQRLGVPFEDENAMGLRGLRPTPASDWATYYDAYVRNQVVNIPLTERIARLDAPLDGVERRNAYIAAGRRLMPAGVKHSAALMRVFVDIVRPPPFVKEVQIVQEGSVRYHAIWEEKIDIVGCPAVRELRKQVDDPLFVKQKAEIRFKLGPRDTPTDWQIDLASVELGSDPADLIDLDGPVREEDGWLVQRVKEFRDLRALRFKARDKYPHFKHRRHEGNELDDDPASIATVKPSGDASNEKYDWEGYEPDKADAVHKLRLNTFTLEPCESQCLSYNLETPKGEIAVRADIELGEATDVVSTNPDSPDITFSGRIRVIGRGLEASSCPFPRLDRQLPLKVRLWRHPMGAGSVMSLTFDNAFDPWRCPGFPENKVSPWPSIIAMMSPGAGLGADAMGGLPVTRTRGQDGWIYEVSRTTNLGGQELRWRIRVREASMRRP